MDNFVRGGAPDERGAYVVAVFGALLGAMVGVVAGYAVGLPLANWALDSVDIHTDAEGMEAFGEFVFELMLAFLLIALAFFVALVVMTWLASVIGCGVALRVFGYPQAKRTAMFLGLIGPVVVLALAKVTHTLFPSSGNDETFVAGAVGIALTALVARRLAARTGGQVKRRRTDSAWAP